MSHFAPHEGSEPQVHQRLVVLLAGVRDALERGEPTEARTTFEHFVVAFGVHLRQEEELEFPAYAHSSAAAAADVSQMLRQHARLRSLAGSLIVDLQAGTATPAMIMEFEFAWSLHDQQEARAFHSWLAERPPPRSSQGPIASA